MSTKGSKYIFLLRHLATTANQRGLLMGRKIDPPVRRNLCTNYKYFIQILRPFSRNAVFYSSPTLRCRQTAQLVISAFGATPKSKFVLDDRLNETDFGKFSGKTIDELKLNNPNFIKQWSTKPERIRFPSGESYEEVSERVLQWLREITQDQNNNVFAVTHSDVIKIIVLKTLSIPISKKRFFHIGPGSLTVLLNGDNQELKVVSLNSANLGRNVNTQKFNDLVF